MIKLVVILMAVAVIIGIFLVAIKQQILFIPLSESNKNTSLQCVSDDDCDTGAFCNKPGCGHSETCDPIANGNCKKVEGMSCRTNDDCVLEGYICKFSRCVRPSKNSACETNNDCGTGQICFNKSCLP
jgi:hypothetical protein